MSIYRRSKWMLILSMVIFSTIGLIRRFLPLESSFIALARGIIGCLFLCTLKVTRHEPFDGKAVTSNLPALLFSGAAMGFNWILLFEAYRYTSVAVATLCYYLAPVIVVMLSSVLLKEKLSRKKIICVFLSLVGMILVSGVLNPQDTSSNQAKGVLFGILAAVLYASVVIINKRMGPVPSYDKTIIQLFAASISLLPYVLITKGLPAELPGGTSILLLLVAGIVHTGIAYCLYFGSIGALKGQTVALLSYLDPVAAVFLSVLILREPLSILGLLGAILVLGSAFFSEKE